MDGSCNRKFDLHCKCVLRLSFRYANTQTLEEGYGINMVPLATFAMETYSDDSCKVFYPKIEDP